MGWMLVRLVTWRDNRPFNQMLQNHGTYLPMIKLFLFAAIFFITSGTVVLRHPGSMDSYCSNAPDNLNIDRINEVGCNIYSETDMFKYNYFYWTTGVMLGLHFTHLSRSSFFGSFYFGGHWTFKEYFILIGGAGVLTFAFSTILSIYSQLGILGEYMIILAGIFGFMALGIAIFGIHTFHFHHYQMAMMLVFFSCL